MNISLENVLIFCGATIFSLLSYFISKTFKDLTSKLDGNSAILEELKLKIAVFTEKFGHYNSKVDKLEIQLQHYHSEYKKKFEKYDNLAVEFVECRKQCQRCVEKKA